MDSIRISTLLKAVFRQNINVHIDGIHNASDMRVDTSIKFVRDDLHIFRNDFSSKPAGTLVMSGSGPKTIDYSRSMLKNVENFFLLKDWPVPVTLRMAAEHGLLLDPRRFLCMYAAFGGLPGAWKSGFSADLADMPKNVSFYASADLEVYSLQVPKMKLNLWKFCMEKLTEEGEIVYVGSETDGRHCLEIRDPMLH